MSLYSIGVYGSFNCNLYDHKIAIPITLKSANEELFKSSIWGPTCDALDQVKIYKKNENIILLHICICSKYNEHAKFHSCSMYGNQTMKFRPFQWEWKCVGYFPS